MRTISLAFLALLLSVSAVVGTSPVRGASFQGLGLPPGGGEVYVNAISADGSTVVGDISSGEFGESSEAFRWTAAGGIQELGALETGSNRAAMSVSDDGAFVYGVNESMDTLAHTPFRWSSAGGMQELVDLSGFFEDGEIVDISSDGSTVVGLGFTDEDFAAFHWSEAGGLQDLGSLPETFGTQPVAVSDDGSVVVGGAFGFETAPAFRWTSAGGMQDLGTPPGAIASFVTAVSGDGATVVGMGFGEFGPSDGFRWTTADGMQGLGMSFPLGVNRDGSVIVGVVFDEAEEAAIWDAANGWRSLPQLLVNDYGLDLTGWTLNAATAVSADGLTIAGEGINPAGQNEAWIARLDAVPEPTSVALLCVGGVLLVRRRRGTGLRSV